MTSIGGAIRFKSCLACVIAVIVGFTSIARATIATSYIVTDLGDLPGGVDESRATGINAYGQVVGLSRVGWDHAFLWTPSKPNGTAGTLIDIGTLPQAGLDQSYAYGINDYGQVVGASNAANGTRAFLWTPGVPNGLTGSMIDLGAFPQPSSSSVAFDINNRGQVTGYSFQPGVRAFLWNPLAPNGTVGSMYDLGALEPQNGTSQGLAINDWGQVAGTSHNVTNHHAMIWNPSVANGTTGMMYDLGISPKSSYYGHGQGIDNNGRVIGHNSNGSVPHAFLWTPSAAHGSTGSAIDLGVIPTTGNWNSDALGINSYQVVVGTSGVSGGHDAFVWSAASGMQNLNYMLEPLSGAGWDLDEATAINDFGQIVGRGTHDGVEHAFLLTPVSEPATSLLMLLASLPIAAMAHYFGSRT